jgi:hypothetical protein
MRRRKNKEAKRPPALTKERLQKLNAAFVFPWHVWLQIKLNRIDWPEANCGKPKRGRSKGLPALKQSFKPMSEGAKQARVMRLAENTSVKGAGENLIRQIKERIGEAWLKVDGKEFLRDFREAYTVKKTRTTKLRRETAAVYRWMLQNMDAIEACTGAAQILKLVKSNHPNWSRNESGFFALLREIGLPKIKRVEASKV